MAKQCQREHKIQINVTLFDSFQEKLERKYEIIGKKWMGWEKRNNTRNMEKIVANLPLERKCFPSLGELFSSLGKLFSTHYKPNKGKLVPSQSRKIFPTQPTLSNYS